METEESREPKSAERNYWHYFFEFFMLFLAVFCGFLAENFRENQAEHQLEKQYMATLLEDLKADTAEFGRLKNMSSNIRNRMDSVIKYMRPPIAKEKVEQYYLEMMRVTTIISFAYNDRTTEQLKSSGAFRLIQKNNVADSIVVYDNRMRGVFTKNYNVLWDHRLKLISMFEEIIDISLLRHIKKDYPNNLVYLDTSYKTNPFSRMQMLTNDNATLMKAYNASIDQVYFAGDLTNWIKRMNIKAVGLIQLIQKEYELE